MEDIIAAKSTTRELVVRRGKNVVHRGEGSGGGIVRHKHRRGQEIVRRGEDLVATKKSSIAAKTPFLPAVWLLSRILPCWFLRRVLEGSPSLLVVLINVKA